VLCHPPPNLNVSNQRESNDIANSVNPIFRLVLKGVSKLSKDLQRCRSFLFSVFEKCGWYYPGCAQRCLIRLHRLTLNFTLKLGNSDQSLSVNLCLVPEDCRGTQSVPHRIGEEFLLSAEAHSSRPESQGIGRALLM
jgi:hypothetical protein